MYQLPECSALILRMRASQVTVISSCITRSLSMDMYHANGEAWWKRKHGGSTHLVLVSRESAHFDG